MENTHPPEKQSPETQQPTPEGRRPARRRKPGGRRAGGAAGLPARRSSCNVKPEAADNGSKSRRSSGRILSADESRRRRLAIRPQPTYDPALPIVARREEIVAAIRNHPVVVISGETGSGKTTQIPKFCLEAGRGVEGRIGCTQPRRIAALTVAGRIAEELNSEAAVGYKIRFADKTPPDALIKIMTDGILLAETQGDRYLREYDTLIIDEAHERSLNIDFVLGLLKNLLTNLMRRRRDLKLIITSATIDTEKFSKAFDNAPVIEVSGRMFPVETRYAPPEDEEGEEQSHVDAAVAAVADLHRKRPMDGDILVFMPTEQDIRETCELLEGRNLMGAVILPLFGRLAAGEQARVFKRMGARKIIVATNVAETSITIPGIQYVVDTGLARISQYSPRTRTTALPVAPISRSSADQRMGRCGRVRNGVCIRLYSEDDYENRPRFTPPEILRSNLAEVILRMIHLRLGDVAAFPFIDPPSARHIQDGYDGLLELGAIAAGDGDGVDGGGRFVLTEKGRRMARMPLDPRLARMLIDAGERGCITEVAVIAAALSIQDPRERPAEKQALADARHRLFAHPQSDFAALLNIWNGWWNGWHDRPGGAKSAGALKKFCKENFLSFRRMREWRDIYEQIRAILADAEDGPAPAAPGAVAETEAKTSGDRYAAIHQCLLAGFLSNIASKKENKIFGAGKGRMPMIFPGSGLFNNPPPWIMAAEMVETSRLFARAVAAIDVEWIEPLAGHLCRRAWLNPRWDRQRGEVVADEQVSLYGLIIEPGRRVAYGRVDPAGAAGIFVESALVEGEVDRPFAFMKHNAARVREVLDMEDRLRRRDLLVSESERARFYRERLPEIADIRSLAALIKRRGDKFLMMRREDLLNYDPDAGALAHFPKQASLGNTAFPLEYHFDPGSPEDGVTVRIPAAAAPSVPLDALDWVVPGLMRGKVTALIKGLPKEYRKRLVPVTETVDRIMDALPERPEGPLINVLSNLIARRLGIQIPASAWPLSEVPEHLRMRIAVTSPTGEILRADRNPAVLYQATGGRADSDAFADARREWERFGLADWDFGDLPDSVTLAGRGGARWTAYPALRPAEGGKGADLALHESVESAAAGHPMGVAALFKCRFPADIKSLKRAMKLDAAAGVGAKYFGGAAAVETAMAESAADELFARNIRKRDDFMDLAEKALPALVELGQKRKKAVAAALAAHAEARQTLYELEIAHQRSPGIMALLENLRQGLANLAPENFIELYETDRMVHLERYIRALTIRARRAVVNFEKDQAKAAEVQPHAAHLGRLLEILGPGSSAARRRELEAYHWLIEEFKVSLFAQELKTPVKVSAKRLEAQRAEVERMI